MNSRCRREFTGIALILCLVFFCGCIPDFADETPLALVENEPVTYGEFKRELQRFHLGKGEKAQIGEIDIKDFLDKLIRKRLFIQEALRTGLGEGQDVNFAMDSELKKRAIMHLHREEVDDKVMVSDDEAWEEYQRQLDKRRKEVEKISLGFSMDPNTHHKTVSNYLSRLRKRAKIEIYPNFVWRGDADCDPNLVVAQVNGMMIMCKDLSLAIDAVRNESGETKDWKIVLQGLIDRRLLDQEIERFVPSWESFEKAKKRLKKSMLKERRQEREAEYLEELRQNAEISKKAMDPDEILKGSIDPNQPVAWVNKQSITFGDLKSGISLKELTSATQEGGQKIVENRLKYLIDCILVDQEALSRGYDKLPDVRKAIEAVREKIIYNKFFNKLLIPSIKITDDQVETYYREHPDIFRTPIYVKIEEIRLKTEEEADQIRAELESGANFNFLSKRSLPDRITGIHWISVNRFPENIKEGLIKTKEGNRFGPTSWEEGHSIFLLKRRRGGEPVPFDRVKKDANNMLRKERFNQAVEKWDATLRSSSDIVIYEDRLKAILSGVGGKS